MTPVPFTSSKLSYGCKAVGHGLCDLLRAVTRRAPHQVPIVGPPESLAVMNKPGCDEGYRRLVPNEAAWANSCPARILLTSLWHRPIARAARLKAPTLFVVAERDQLIPARTIRRAAERMSDATVVTVPGDHFAPYFGETFQQAVRQEADFLEGCLLNAQTLPLIAPESSRPAAKKDLRPPALEEAA